MHPNQIKALVSQWIHSGSTTFPRTGELRVAPPAPAMPVSAAVGDCASVRWSQRDRLALRPLSGTAGVDALAFEQAKETFGCGVVGTTPHCTHAARDVVRGQELLVLV